MKVISNTFFHKAELFFARLQGKGYGGHKSLDTETRIAGNFLSENSIIFDVGANKGCWSKKMLEKYNGTIEKIYLFEPSKHNWEPIEKLGIDKLALQKKAAADFTGEATIYSNKEGSTLASLSKRQLDHYNIQFDIEEKVDAVTLDDFTKEHNIKYIDFLKIDVEGHELDVFKGAGDILSQGKVKAVQFEFGGCNIDSRTYLKDLYFFLKERGYHIGIISPGAKIYLLEKYHESNEFFVTTNYLAWKD